MSDGTLENLERTVAGRIGPTPTPGTVAEFACELKRLVRQGAAGRLKVSALARRVDISQSTLYAYLAGTTLPPTEVLDALLREVGAAPDVVRRMATARDALGRRRRHGEADAPTVVPRELPLEPTGFAGRAAELTRLATVLDQGDPTVPLVAISGTAGVGKTALALHWSHRVADRFPDGSLYVDLLGYSGGTPRTPGDVLAGLLRSLGASTLPDDADERARLYRSMVAGRRMLVLLDNAVDAEQVRPLLPGAASCLVVVTSRVELTGLQVQPGALPVVLQPLSDDEGLEVLAGRAGADAPSPAATALLDRCGGLPLALRIVAARASSYPVDGLAAVAADLLDRNGLDGFEIGDAATSVRAVFSWSERHLEPEACRLFWLMGLLPHKETDPETAAALAGIEPHDARRHLDALLRAHLVEAVGRTEPAAARFALHDLLREHAREQAVANLTPEERTAALERMVDEVRATCSRAMELLHISWDEHPPEPTAGGPGFDGAEQAQAWLRAEWANLLAVLELTATQGWVGATRDLAELLRRHLDQGGRHRDAARVLGHLLTACREAGDLAGEATALRDLGVAGMRLGDHTAAMAHFDQALDAARRSGDVGSEAGALNNLGNLHERLCDYDAARRCYEQALPLAVAVGIRGGEATLHNNIAVTHKGLGNAAEAIEHCRVALDIFEELGDLGGRARSLGNLGEAHRLAGDTDRAVVRLDEALALARRIDATGIELELLNALGETRTAAGDPGAAVAEHEAALEGARTIGDRYEEARALEGIGSARVATGRDEEAAASWRRSLAIFTDLGLPEADRVRRRLDGLPEAARVLTA